MVAYSTAEQVISCPPSPMLSRVEQTIARIAQARERLTVAHQCLDEVRVRGKMIHPPPPSELSERLQHTVAVPDSVSYQKKQHRGKDNSQDQDV